MPNETPDLHFQALPLTGDAGDAFVALAALLQAATFAEDAVADYETRALELGSRLVARARGAEGAPSDAELRLAAIEHTEELGGVAGEHDFEIPESVDQIPEELMGLAEEIIREAGLEFHTHDSYLALQGDTDDLLLVVHPVSVASAHVWLLESLLERVESSLAHEPLDALERGASAWYFERWRPSRPSEDQEFAAGVREQEFSLADRPTLLDQVPFLERIVADEEMMAALPPRQRHMARQLLGSVLGVWTVRAREGDELALVSPIDGGELAVLDHGGSEEFGPGAVVVGRLIPFHEETWLRSPGALILPQGSEEMARTLADALARAEETDYPPAVVLEGIITTVTTGEIPPRRVPPARSASEAREALASVGPIFLAAGVAREMDRDSLPPEVRDEAPAGPLLDYEVDDVIADWIGALTEMARKGTGGGKSKAKRRKRR